MPNQILLDLARELGCTVEQAIFRFRKAVAELVPPSPSDPIPDADEILLGELLNGTQDFQMVSTSVAAADFARPAHRQIWQCMEQLYERREKIDRVMVANELLKANQLETCGGLDYIIRLSDYGAHSGV